jgi:hypothetical protein
MVAVVFQAGFPAVTVSGCCGSVAKQLAAVAIHWGATRAPEQARSASPMTSLAVKAYVPSVTGSPATANAGVVVREVAAAAAATSAATVAVARGRDLDT